MQLFALSASRELAARVAGKLGVELAALEEREFEDGEFKVRPLQSVRGGRVVVWQSLGGDADASAADKLCRLLFLAGAIKDAGAAALICVAPYLAFARKDRRTKPRDPVTTRYVAEMLEAVGCDTIVTMDVHNVAAFENAFRRPTVHIEAAPALAAHFAAAARGAAKVVVLAPDAGGMKRARAFAKRLETDCGRAVALAFSEKARSEGQVSGSAFAGDVDGALVIVLDDLVSSGTTLARAANAALQGGAEAVHAAVTHGLFSGNAEEVLRASGLASIVVTDTVADGSRRCPALADRLVVLDTADLFADALRRL